MFGWAFCVCDDADRPRAHCPALPAARPRRSPTRGKSPASPGPAAGPRWRRWRTAHRRTLLQSRSPEYPKSIRLIPARTMAEPSTSTIRSVSVVEYMHSSYVSGTFSHRWTKPRNCLSRDALGVVGLASYKSKNRATRLKEAARVLFLFPDQDVALGGRGKHPFVVQAALREHLAEAREERRVFLKNLRRVATSRFPALRNQRWRPPWRCVFRLSAATSRRSNRPLAAWRRVSAHRRDSHGARIPLPLPSRRMNIEDPPAPCSTMRSRRRRARIWRRR